MNSHIFISHSSKDDEFVTELRRALEGQRLTVWVDSRELRGGDELTPEVVRAIEQAGHFVAVLSPNAFNSGWVRREIQTALRVKRQRGGEAYRVVPLLLPGVEPAALPLWFGEEPVGVSVKTNTGGVGEALHEILAALGEVLPEDRTPPRAARPARPVAELRLELTDAEIVTGEGKRRVAATAAAVYRPADPSARTVESKRFRFTAPLGPIEAEDLRWYLESYYLWPTGVFNERARLIEEQLPRWGRALYDAALGTESAREALAAWQHAPAEAERRFSVLVDSDAPEGSEPEEQAAARQAASELLSLPWELLHDADGYLFEGRRATRVRRLLPNRRALDVKASGLPIRILLVSPRPEDEGARYIDHRASALPLVEAVESLGELAELKTLAPPTFPALGRALREAEERGEPFDVIHFDGHGVFDREHVLGGLCFEDPRDEQKLEARRSLIVNARELAGLMRHHRIPLVFLEACESAVAEEDPTASVAASLLDEGVASVVAMTHTVLVETARRFVKVFYGKLCEGVRVGTAMLAGQQALQEDTFRGRIMGAGELRLQDWFVPVLYQEEQDARLITAPPSDTARELEARRRQLSLGRLPPPPSHHFQGRSRELLQLERLLAERRYAVARGQGGAGKTTLAAELARWLVRTNRHERAAFVSLEHHTDVRAVMDSLGQQLLPEGERWSVAQFNDLTEAFKPIRRALRDDSTLIVLDNMESVLPDSSGQPPLAAAPVEELFNLCQDLLDSAPATRLLFTTREPLPAPFDSPAHEVAIGALSREDAVALVSQVMADEGHTPPEDDPGSTPQEITDLVEAANRHARALVLLAREVARRGVRATTQDLHHIMRDLHTRYPNDREQSLYASLELSLRRLPPETRRLLQPLALFHGGANLGVLGHILGTQETELLNGLAEQLINVGLAEYMGYGHLRLDPALPSYLLREMTDAEREGGQARWAEATEGLLYLLSQQQFKDPKSANRSALLELPNLMSLLESAFADKRRDKAVEIATHIEGLISFLGRTQALARVIQVREQAVEQLEGWSHTQFVAEGMAIERLQAAGNLRAAYDAAQRLLQRCMAAGEVAYSEAAYDIATAYLTLGRALEIVGAAEAALAPLGEGRRRFQALADAGIMNAARMAAVALADIGNCLLILGRLSESADVYLENIRCAEQLNDQRQIAVAKTQLGTVRLMQRRYGEALEIYGEARSTFEGLGEPASVAKIWHQIGRANSMAGQYEAAERAFRQSLALKVQQKMPEGEATTLFELGNLYKRIERLEDSVAFYRQAANIAVQLQNLHLEGTVCNNLAIVLISLQRYDEARHELLRAIGCQQHYGHAGEVWKAWSLLYDLERETGDSEAAARARQKAIVSFMAYRRDGGENQNAGAMLCEVVAQAVEQNKFAEAEKALAELPLADSGPWAQVMVPKLQAILEGDRNPALADDPELYYQDAVELQLLLERLGA